jgi:hypothetical protein
VKQGLLINGESKIGNEKKGVIFKNKKYKRKKQFEVLVGKTGNCLNAK